MPVLVGLSIAGTTAMGTTTLVRGETGLISLSEQIDTDLGSLQQAVDFLYNEVELLAEVVLQNRRSLDLLFLSQGGLFAALGKSCCFYANKSGIIKETLQMVKQNLELRQLDHESNYSWFHQMFNWNPWLTTLLSATAGPLIFLLITLIFGPCLINSLVSFIYRQISAVKLINLHIKYEMLSPQESMIGLCPREVGN